MNFRQFLVVFLLINRVHVSNLKNFVDIKISYKNETFMEPKLTVIRFNSSNFCHNGSRWMKERKGKPWIQCQVQMRFTRCFCDLEGGNCWDFEDVMEAVYTLGRDPAIASIPKHSSSDAGNEKKALEKIITILNTLHDNAPNMSLQLEKEHAHSVDRVFDEDNCRNIPQPVKNDKKTLDSRKEVELLIYLNNSSSCFQFFSPFSRFLYSRHSTRILAMREKLLDQINSNQKLFVCESNLKYCDLERVKKKELPEKLKLFLDYTKFQTKALHGYDFDNSKAKNYFDWKPTQKSGSSKVQGIVVAWTQAAVLLALVFFITRSVCQYEHIGERSPLNPTMFKLKDLEIELKKAMMGKTPEGSVMTLEVTRYVENAKRVDKKKHTRTRASIFRSVRLKTPMEYSDLESMKRREDPMALNLQKTQNDETEFIGTAIETKVPVPKQTRATGAEPSVLSKTDQGTFVNREKSDEAVAMRSVQKTQSLSDPDVIEMPPLPPPPPNPSPHQPPPPPPQIPTVTPSSRNRTPLHNIGESKKLRRKKPKSKASAKTPRKLKKKKSKADRSQKEKPNFLSFWS